VLLTSPVISLVPPLVVPLNHLKLFTVPVVTAVNVTISCVNAVESCVICTLLEESRPTVILAVVPEHNPDVTVAVIVTASFNVNDKPEAKALLVVLTVLEPPAPPIPILPLFTVNVIASLFV